MASVNVLLSLTDHFTSPLRSAGSATRQVQRQISQANNTMSRFGEGIAGRVNGLIGSLSSLAGAMGALSIGAFAMDGIETYKNFDQAMHNLAATAGITADSSNEAYARIEAKARELGSTTSKTASEAAEAMNYMCLAGWSVDDVMGNVNSVLTLSEATGMDLAAASDAVTDSMSALGLKAGETSTYLNMVAKAQQSSNMTAAMMFDAYKSVGGQMSKWGIPLEESGTALGVLANRGIKAAEAGNSLSSIMTNLYTPTGQAKDALEQLGVHAYDAEGNAKGLKQVLSELQEATKGMTNEQRDNFLAMVSGKEQAKTLNGLLQGMNNTLDNGKTEWEDLTDKLKNAGNALDEMAATQKDTLKGSMDTFRSALEDVQITLVSAFAPALRMVLDLMSGSVLPAFGNELKYFGEKILPSLVNGFVALAPVLAGAVTGFLAFQAITGIVGVLTAVETAMAGVTAAGGLMNFVLMANPITLYAVAIGAVVAALILLWKNCEGFRNAVTAAWEHIKSATAPIIDMISAAFTRLGEKFTALGEKLKPIGEAIMKVLTPVFTFIGGALVATLEMAIGVVGGIISGIATAIGGAVDLISGIIDVISGLFDGNMEQVTSGLTTAFEGAFNLINGIANGAIGGLVETIGNLLSPVADIVKGKLEPIVGVATGIFNSAKEAITGIFGGDNPVDDVTNEIASAGVDGVTSAASAAQDIGISFIDGLKSKFDTAGEIFGGVKDKILSVVNFENLKIRGEAIFSAFENLKETAGNAIAPVVDIVSEKINALPEKLSKIGAKVSEILQPVINTVKEKWQQLTSIFSGGGDDAEGGIGNSLSGVADSIEPKISKISSVVSGLADIFIGIGSAIISALEPVATFFGDVLVTGVMVGLQLLAGVVGGVFDGIVITIYGLVDVISGIVEVISGLIAGDWAMVWQGLQDVVLGTINAVTGIVQGLVSGITYALSQIIDFLTGVFVAGWEGAWNSVQSIFTGIIDSISGIFNGFISTITSGLDSILSKAASAVGISAQGHATGTSYFRGGLTTVNEQGGELMNLPSGTQIIPHDLSEKMVTEAAKPIFNQSVSNIAVQQVASIGNSVFSPVVNVLEMLKNGIDKMSKPQEGNTEETADNGNMFPSLFGGYGYAPNVPGMISNNTNTTDNYAVDKSVTNNNTDNTSNRDVTVNVTVQGNVLGNDDFMNQCGRHITDSLLAALNNM